MTVAQAEESTLRGEHDAALRELETVLADVDHEDFATAIRIAAAIHAHRGTSNRSAELLGLVDPAGLGDSAAASSVAHLAVGDLATAEQLIAASGSAAPTSTAGAWRSTAIGLRQTLVGDGVTGVPPLLQAVAALAPLGRSDVMIDSPAALAALAALHLGELDLAQSVLDRSVTSDLGGALFRPRHQILLAWVAMARGDLAQATSMLDAVGVLPHADARDVYLAHAVRVGTARRSSDTGALSEAWAQARTAVTGVHVDLFHVLPLGELLAGAARMDDEHWLASQLQDAQALLHRLGRPALWSTMFHWYGVQAAIDRDRPDALMPHAEAIRTAARVSRHAQTLAAAGHTWVRVLGRDVELPAVQQAVSELIRVGLAWDGSRLAAQAALHSADRKVSLDLLQTARAAHAAFSVSAPSAATTRGSQLTDREWEIARLVVGGIGYKEIGERLFISPRTVEHHVASIRRRLGAANRTEMLEVLRRLVGAEDAVEA